VPGPDPKAAARAGHASVCRLVGSTCRGIDIIRPWVLAGLVTCHHFCRCVASLFSGAPPTGESIETTWGAGPIYLRENTSCDSPTASVRLTLWRRFRRGDAS